MTPQDEMTPQDHYREAEYHARLAFGDEWSEDDEGGDGGPRDVKWRQRQGQIHATLALAGFTRDAAEAASERYRAEQSIRFA